MLRYRTPLTIVILLLGFTIIVPNTFAAEKTTLIQDVYSILGVALNIIYIITLPLLTIAGKALDNSMVYGEFLNLDKPLYMLWNISRTFANFAIGGVCLYNIIKYFFTERGDNIAELKKVIINSAIAVLGINFSWFIVGALLDLSTILIYSLGSMPLSILNQTTTSNMPILSVNTFLDYSSDNSKTYMYYQRQGSQGMINIAQCGQNGNIYKQMVTGPEYYPTLPNSKPEVSFKVNSGMKTFCAIHNDVVDVSNVITWREANLSSHLDNSSGTGTDYQYHQMTKEIIDKISSATGDCSTISIDGFNTTAGPFTLSSTAQVQSFADTIPTFGQKTFCNGQIKFGNTNISNIISSQGQWKKGFITANTPGYEGYSNENGFSIKTLIDQSKGMVGPFVTLYVSLLDFSNLSINNSDSQDVSGQAIGAMIEFLMRTIIGIMLLVPLIALTVVIIMRVVLMWGVIAFIPLGIAAKLLFDGKGIEGQQIFGAELNAKSIIGLIFAPVLPVFALSISIIFIQAIQGQMGEDFTSKKERRSLLGIEFVNQPNNPNLTCADFRGLQELCYKTDDDTKSGSIFVNLFPRLFTNIFAIALMRFLVKAAMAASPLTQKAADSIMGAGQSLLSNIPLIPIGDGKRVGLGAASTIPERFMSTANNALDNLDKEGETALYEMIKNGMDNKGLKTDEQINGTPKKIELYSSTKENTKKKIQESISTNPRITNQSFLESFKAGAQGNKDDEQESQRIQSITQGGQQTNEIVGIIEDIYKAEENKKKEYASHVIIDRLGTMLSGTLDGGNWSGTLQAGKEKEFEEFINLPNIKPYIIGNTQLKTNIQKLNYKGSDQKEYTLNDDLKRTPKT